MSDDSGIMGGNPKELLDVYYLDEDQDQGVCGFIEL